MTLVAFNGKLGSGKDTAGERLAAMVGVPTYRRSFASPLKESAAALLDIPVEDWETYKNDPDVKILLADGYETFDLDGSVANLEQPKVVKEFTAREFLQRYGTESHREIFGEDFWVEQALASYFPSEALTYITDCRFVNEAQAVRDRRGYIIQVVGPDHDTGEHASETPLAESLIDFVVVNDMREDDFATLDWSLKSLASMLGIPLKEENYV